MGKWKEVKLKDVIRVINGRAYKKPELLSEGKYRVLRVGNLFTNNSWYHSDLELPADKYCEKGDLIYAWSASFGPRIWQEEKVIYHYHIWKMICDETVIDKDFAFQFLDWVKDMMKKEHSRGVGMFHLTKSAIEDRKLFLPPLPVQQRIVTKLDGLFSKIDKAIGLLEENILHTKALMGSVLDGIFDKIYKEHKSVPLLKHVDFIGGSQPPKSNFSYELKEGYIRLIQIRDYKSDRHLVYIKENSTKKFCDEQDVMIGRYGPPVFQILRGLKGAYNVALMKAIPDEEVILKDYLYYFLMNGRIQNYIISISQRAAGQSGVNKKALEAYEIAIPSLKEQQKIIDTIKAAIPKIDKAQELTNQNLENLKSLKSSLLDQAFKGEL
jgi:type I restriction enzyme S subunit